MSVYVGIVASGPPASLALDLQSLTARIANLLQRSDLNSEIEMWINFVQRDMAKKIKFAVLRTGIETSMISSPATYLYDLPADYSMMDRVYYRNETDASNTWGRNLTPLPRKFYAGDTVDLERLLNVSVPNTGDPLYYWVDKNQLGIYPALASDLTGKLQLWYYKLPPDVIYPSDEPSIPNEFRQHMIPLAIFWGKILAAQASTEIPILGFWKKMYDETMKTVKGEIRQKENPREVMEPPETGMEYADRVY